MKDFFDKQEWDNEILTFLVLCSPEDAAFMSTPAKKRKAEDYVRLMTLALVFGFRRVSMRVLQEAEEKGADIAGAGGKGFFARPRVGGGVHRKRAGRGTARVRARGVGEKTRFRRCRKFSSQTTLLAVLILRVAAYK